MKSTFGSREKKELKINDIVSSNTLHWRVIKGLNLYFSYKVHVYNYGNWYVVFVSCRKDSPNDCRGSTSTNDWYFIVYTADLACSAFMQICFEIGTGRLTINLFWINSKLKIIILSKKDALRQMPFRNTTVDFSSCILQLYHRPTIQTKRS